MSWPDLPLGDSLEVFIRPEDDPEAAAKLKTEERELKLGGLNESRPFRTVS